MGSRPASGRCAARASSPKRRRRAVRGWQGCGRPARFPTQSIQSTSRRAAYLILVLGFVSRSCSSTSSHDLCCPTIGAEAAYLILVLGFVGCGVLAVVRHSVRTRKQPTTTHTEFSWTRVFLDPPLASRHFGDGDGAVHGTGTVHHRRTLL